MPGGSPIHIIASSSWINFQDKVRIVSTKWGKGGIREFTLCHSTFPVCCDKVTWQKQPKTKAGDVFWLTVLVQSIMVGSQDWRSLRELITLGTGQETVINMFSKFFPFPYNSRPKPWEWCHPKWAGLPTSMIPNKITLHRHVQEPVSQGDPRFFRVDSWD